eukprot:CAMPEP_0204919846 /NCGR_PEP_ID=MMETSP1397-20131031/17048_1 /ASSEMBLY_ACC=CAM_ASM_000891 /TAXON_ID=49980 /ORGANISM="Climacostomum Climacostomum virens, Strain Stock W-24" /LENGTH=767 /DNA_ID=CAMNT_0052093477 /DNA_START=4535 /DNA_END=6838 /DNA_ORIENTATION=-
MSHIWADHRKTDLTPYSDTLKSPQKPESVEFSPVVSKHSYSVRKADPRKVVNLQSLRLSSSTEDVLAELGLEVDSSEQPLPTEEEVKLKQEAELRVITEEVKRLRSQTELRPVTLSESLSRQSLSHLLRTALHSQEHIDESALDRCSSVIREVCEKELQEKEAVLRLEIEQQFDAERVSLQQKYEAEMNKAILAVQERINSHWNRKAMEIELQLKLNEELSDSEAQESIESELVAHYQTYFEDLFEEEREKIRAQLERELHDELRQIQSAPLRRQGKQEVPHEFKEKYQAEMQKMRERLEVEFEMRLVSEEESWRANLAPKLVQEIQKRHKENATEQLALRKQQLHQQANRELQDLINKIKEESDEAVLRHLRQIDEEAKKTAERSRESLKAEIYHQLQHEREQKLQENIVLKLKGLLTNEISRELQPKIELEVKQELEQKYREEAQAELSQGLGEFLRKVDNDNKSALRRVSEQLELTRDEAVKASVEEQMIRFEKELKVKYAARADRLTNDTQDQFLKELENRLQDEREQLARDRAEVSRLKSAVNVQLHKASKERKEELDRIKEQEKFLQKKLQEREGLLKRMQDVSVINKSYERAQPERIKDRPDRPLSQQSTLFHKEDKVENTPQFQSPRHFPVMSRVSPVSVPFSPEPARYIGYTAEEPKQISPPRRLLSPYRSEDTVQKLISQNIEEAHRQALRLLAETENPPEIKPRKQAYTEDTQRYYRPKEQEQEKPSQRLSTAKPSHQLYRDLLRMNYGVIEPRLK